MTDEQYQKVLRNPTLATYRSRMKAYIACYGPPPKATKQQPEQK